MKKTIFLALAMVICSGCGKADSAECPDIRTQARNTGIGNGISLHIRARDDISIHNIIINRGNCLYVYKGGFYRNGVDRIQSGNRPLTSDMVESMDWRDKEIAYKEIENHYKSWRGNFKKYDCYHRLGNMDELFKYYSDNRNIYSSLILFTDGFFNINTFNLMKNYHIRIEGAEHTEEGVRIQPRFRASSFIKYPEALEKGIPLFKNIMESICLR